MAGRIPEQVIEEINRKVSIIDVIGETVQLKRTGNRYLGLCPFHHEKTPSFTVDPEKQLFYCFGCQTGGNLFGYLQKRDHLTFVEAARVLAERAGIPIPEDAMDEADAGRMQLRQQLYDACEAALLFYQHQYHFHPEAKAARLYLIKRALEPDTIDTFRLGYAPPEWRLLADHLIQKGFSADVLEQAGLIIRQPSGEGFYDRFRDRIIFPIFDYRNRCIGFGGRVLSDEQPKYLNSPQTAIFDKGKNLYGIHMLKNQHDLSQIIVYEGYMDYISTWQAGIHEGVASLGTALTMDQCRLLKRYTEKVILCYDADSAGERATQRGMFLLRKAGLNVLIAQVPGEKDPDDYVRHNGGESFQQVLNAALPMYHYFMEQLKKKYDLQTVEGKSGYVREFASVLSESDSPVEIDGYIRELARQLQITENAIYREMKIGSRNDLASSDRKEGTAHSISEIKPSDVGKGSLGNRFAEETLLRLAFNHARFGKLLTEKVEITDFGPTYQSFIAALWPLWQEEKLITITDITTMAEESISSLAAKLEISGETPEANSEKAFDDCVSYLIVQRYRRRLIELTKQFEAMQPEGDMEAMAIVLQQIQGLQRKLGRQR